VVRQITRVVDGDHVTWKRDGKPFAGTTIKLDSKANPSTIDVTPDGGADRDRAVLGIYRLEGDTLTICMAAAQADRPNAFESPAGSKRSVMVFRRVDSQNPGEPSPK
jgi:uncharacterized protein (TIGR03067 family)